MKRKLIRTGSARKRLANARHEAAHAVIGELLGLRVRRVEIFAEENARNEVGLCTYWPNKRCGPLRFAVTSMAGTVADQLMNRRPRQEYSSGDMVHVRSTGLRDAELWLLRDLTLPMVREKLEVIERVAQAIVKRGSLTGAQFRSVARRASRS